MVLNQGALRLLTRGQIYTISSSPSSHPDIACVLCNTTCGGEPPQVVLVIVVVIVIVIVVVIVVVVVVRGVQAA